MKEPVMNKETFYLEDHRGHIGLFLVTLKHCCIFDTILSTYTTL